MKKTFANAEVNEDDVKYWVYHSLLEPVNQDEARGENDGKTNEERISAEPGGPEVIGDTLGIPILQCGLLQEIENLHKGDAWLHSAGPSSNTLVKHPDLRVVLIAMRKNMRMPEHKTTATISLQTLAGHIRLRLPDRTADLPMGQVLV